MTSPMLLHHHRGRGLIMRSFVIGIAVVCCAVAQVSAQARTMRPEDLFRFARIGAMAWSPDAARAAVEIHQPGAWLESSIPTAQIAIVDAASARLRVITPSAPDIIGFFAPAWSPDSRQLLFFSVDTDATVHAWVWPGRGDSPTSSSPTA